MEVRLLSPALLRAGPVALLCILLAGCGAARNLTPRMEAVVVAVHTGNGGPPFDVPRRLLVPAGWTAQVWARVRDARFAVWTPEGSLLVSRPLEGTVVRLDPARDPAAPPRRSVLLAGLSDPQGLAFDTLAGRPVLYVAESDQLDRYAWNGARGVGALTVVARGLPDEDGIDRRKGIAVGLDHTVYVSVGSLSQRPGPRGVVLAFRPGGAERTFATGVGNGVGLAIDLRGALWTAANRGQGGAPDGLARLTAGRHLGQLDRPIAAHSAPLGLDFVKLPAPWSRGAVVALHGSFAPRLRAPAVLWFPWTGSTLGEPQTLVGGFRLADGTRWGRPVDAVPGPDGALYVTDDTAGAIYRLVPRG